MDKFLLVYPYLGNRNSVEVSDVTTLVINQVKLVLITHAHVAIMKILNRCEK